MQISFQVLVADTRVCFLPLASPTTKSLLEKMGAHHETCICKSGIRHMDCEDKISFRWSALSRAVFTLLLSWTNAVAWQPIPQRWTFGPSKNSIRKKKKFKANHVFHRKCQCWQFIKEHFLTISIQNTAPQRKFLFFYVVRWDTGDYLAISTFSM